MQTAILSADRHSARLSIGELNRIIDLDRYSKGATVASNSIRRLRLSCEHPAHESFWQTSSRRNYRDRRAMMTPAEAMKTMPSTCQPPTG